MDSALSALRGAAIEPEQASVTRMEVHVIRRWRLDQDMKSWRWWAPTGIAALAAAAAMLLLIQWGPASPTQSSVMEWPSYTEDGRP